MKIRRAQRRGVTKRSVPAVSGLAALALVFAPHHAVSAPHSPGLTGPADDETSPATQMAHFKELAATTTHRADAAIPLYTVRAGDSISEVAVRKCDGHANDWTDIYRESRREHLTGWNANDINIGQQLAIVCGFDPAELKYAPAPPPPPPPPPVTTSVEQAQGTTSANAIVVVHHRSSGASTQEDQAQGYSGNVNPGSYSGIESCIIDRESGGNSQVMNASGHYGLFQFDYGTWVSGGGAGADFGHASVAEQQRVFDAVYAARGSEPWSPSDGC
jgi:hypothetical protein